MKSKAEGGTEASAGKGYWKCGVRRIAHPNNSWRAKAAASVPEMTAAPMEAYSNALCPNREGL